MVNSLIMTTCSVNVERCEQKSALSEQDTSMEQLMSGHTGLVASTAQSHSIVTGPTIAYADCSQ